MKYKIAQKDILTLKDKGFKYNSEKDNSYYYTFLPVLKHNRMPVLTGKITVFEDGEIRLDCYQQNNAVYPPFYNVEYGNYSFILKEIDNSFSAAFKKYNIYKKGRKHKK